MEAMAEVLIVCMRCSVKRSLNLLGRPKSMSQVSQSYGSSRRCW